VFFVIGFYLGGIDAFKKGFARGREIEKEIQKGKQE